MSIDQELRGTSPTESTGEIAVLPRTRPWRRIPRTGRVLGCLVLIAGGFVGGVLEAKHTGATTASTTARIGPTTVGGATPGGQGANGAGGATVGTVKLVDGSIIYLTRSDGSVVKVSTTGRTTLSLSAAGKTADLKAGATIVVTGATDASGTIKATAVTQSGATTAGAAAGGAPTG